MADDDSLIGIIRDGQVYLKCGPRFPDDKSVFFYLRRKHPATKDFRFVQRRDTLIEDCQEIKQRPPIPYAVIALLANGGGRALHRVFLRVSGSTGVAFLKVSPSLKFLNDLNGAKR